MAGCCRQFSLEFPRVPTKRLTFEPFMCMGRWLAPDVLGADNADTITLSPLKKTRRFQRRNGSASIVLQAV
jgi:hypothetical protein